MTEGAVRAGRAPKPVEVLFLTALLLVFGTTRVRLEEYWGISEALLPLLAVFAGVSVFYALLYAILRHVGKALTLTVFLTIIFFSFGDLALAMQVSKALLVQVEMMAVLIFLILRYEKFQQVTLSTVTVAMLVCTLVYGVEIFRYTFLYRYDLSQIPPRAALFERKDVSAAYTDTSKYPDIYFMIFDAYAANGTLKRLFGFDNAPFLDAMEKKGFYHAADSKSYYMQTMLSVSSTLNANYMQDDIPLPDKQYGDRTPVVDYFLHPRVPRFLQELGYETQWFSTAYAQDYTFNPAVRDIRSPQFRVSIADTLIMRTPVHQILTYIFGPKREFFNPYMRHYEGLKTVVDQVVETARGDRSRPKFTYVHLLLPHPPFVCGQNGDFADYDNLAPFYYADGAYNLYGHLYEGGWTDFYRKAYIETLQCANREALRMADEIIAHRGERPVVIFMVADHGSRMNLDWGKASKTDLNEAFHIFNMVYFSGGDYSGLTPDISPVNTMRVMLNKYFGLGLLKLEDHQWYSAWHRPYDFEEMTGRVGD